MRLRPLLVPVLLAATLALPAQAPRVARKHVFQGREWTIEVPQGYGNGTASNLDPKTTITAFAPVQRLDGTRPMIQVLLMSVPKGAEGPEATAKFGEQMLAGVQRRRDEWKALRAEVKVGTRTMTRYAWSGVSVPATDGAKARVALRGVMLIGSAPGVVFMLHTQDSAGYADQTLAAAETAMATFRIADAAKP